MAFRIWAFIAGVALLIVSVGAARAAEAASPAAAEPPALALSMPAQRLADSLRRLAEVSGLQLLYDARIVEGKTAPAVTGTMSARAALNLLLAGSGLGFQVSGDRTVLLAVAGPGGVRSVGVVSVNGVSDPMPYGNAATVVNGVNGSRDVESTEGTGSYTSGAVSIVSKIPLPLREIPQSVSVITAQQIQDQTLIEARDILQRMPGVTVAPGASDQEFDVYSRGFNVQSYAIDGGAPNTYNYNNRPVLNMSEFDSVQLVRGADGLFGGYGDPGGVVNLVRKKPLDHRQITYDQDVGSWSNFREVLDATGPIAFDGAVRARAVYSQQDNKFFYKVAEAHKKSIYAILDADLAERTLLSVGASYNLENNTPNQNGLPRYSNGEAIDWPTSTCLCVPFAYDRARKTEAFLTLNHAFNDNIAAKINYTYTRQTVDALYFGVSSIIDKGAGTQAFLGGYGSNNPLKQSALDVTTTARFQLWGREQSVVVGGNVQDLDNAGATTTYTSSYPTQLIPDVFHFDPGAYQPPADPGADYTAVKNGTLMYGVYGSLRVAPIDKLHLTLGMRYSGLRETSVYRYRGVADDDVLPILRDRSHSRPNIGLTYDVLDNFTVYGSYQAVYQPQMLARYTQSTFVPPPITGVNEEVGLKWQSADKKLNASLSVYRITQKGFLSTDYSTAVGGFSPNYVPIVNDYSSKGFDLEIAGEIARGLQVSASYAHNENKFTTETSVSPKTSYQPKNIVKTWVTYRAPGTGPLGRLIVGGGINVQSRAFNAGYLCSATDDTPQQNCIAFDTPYRFTTPGYATVSGKLGYSFGPNVEASLKVENLANVKRYAASQYETVASYNFYIPPRSFMAALNLKW